MNNKVIERPTCRTCPYFFDGGPDATFCRATSRESWFRGPDHWCGEHPDFSDYLAALDAQKLRCPECRHYVRMAEEELKASSFKMDGHCNLTNRAIWSDSTCYLFEAKP